MESLPPMDDRLMTQCAWKYGCVKTRTLLNI
jgi:hypothetical protein